jgi:hypothetical protein
MSSRHSAAWAFPPKVKPFFDIDPIGLLVVNQPTFSPEQCMNAPHAVPDSGLSDLLDAGTFSSIILRMGAVII